MCSWDDRDARIPIVRISRVSIVRSVLCTNTTKKIKIDISITHLITTSKSLISTCAIEKGQNVSQSMLALHLSLVIYLIHLFIFWFASTIQYNNFFATISNEETNERWTALSLAELACSDNSHSAKTYLLLLLLLYFFDKSIVGTVSINIVTIIIIITVDDKRWTRVRKRAILLPQAHTSRVSCMAPRSRLRFDLKLYKNEKLTHTDERQKKNNNHFIRDVRHPIPNSFSH